MSISFPSQSLCPRTRVIFGRTPATAFVFAASRLVLLMRATIVVAPMLTVPLTQAQPVQAQQVQAQQVQAQQVQAWPGAAVPAVVERITDRAIGADQEGYVQAQARIKALNDKKIPVGDYYLSKAQCWLDVSFHEYTRNDRSAFPKEALAQSDAITQALDNNTQSNPGDQTPLVNNADRLREDLWQRLATLKAAKGFRCAMQKTACGEVRLVHAGNEYKQQGWRHANPYIQIAEDLTSDAESAAQACPEPARPIIVKQEAPRRVESVERISLSADVLFAFDKSSPTDILREGHEELTRLVERLRASFTQIDSVKVFGHTDRLGSASYNEALSERRAQTVKQVLRDKGVAQVIEAFGKGETEPVKDCGKSKRATPTLLACLQANRRVDIELTGVKRELK